MSIVQVVDLYIGSSYLFLFLSLFACMESIVNKRKTNTRLIVTSTVLGLFIANLVYMHLADPIESYRESECKAEKQINSENVLEFTQICILHSLHKHEASSVETTDSGQLIIQGIPRTESELIRDSYRKVSEYIDSDKENGSIISTKLNKAVDKIPYPYKHIKFATKEDFKRSRLFKLAEEFVAERKNVALSDADYKKLISIASGTYTGSLSLSEINYYQSKIDLFYNADNMVSKWHGYVEKTCSELKESCSGIKATMVDLKRYTSKIDYLTATKVLSNTKIDIDQKINSEFKAVVK